MKQLLLSLLTLASSQLLASVNITDVYGNEIAIQSTNRIISIGGNITETLFALGADDKIVGVDTTSTWPKATQNLPKVGYQRAISSEGILSLAPSLIIATEDAGPPNVIEQIKKTGIPILILPATQNIQDAIVRIEKIAKAINKAEQGKKIIKNIENKLATLNKKIRKTNHRPKTMFLLAHGQRTPLVSGKATAVDLMIELAGGTNSFTDFQNYKPLNPEAIIAAAPTVILTTDLGITHSGGTEKLLKSPGIASTPAAKNNQIIVMDALYLTGFGPRFADAALDLAKQLHSTLN